MPESSRFGHLPWLLLSVLILIADDVQRVLPTVKSRCQPIAFPPLAAGAIAARLEAVSIDSRVAAKAVNVVDELVGQGLVSCGQGGSGWRGWGRRLLPSLGRVSGGGGDGGGVGDWGKKLGRNQAMSLEKRMTSRGSSTATIPRTR